MSSRYDEPNAFTTKIHELKTFLIAQHSQKTSPNLKNSELEPPASLQQRNPELLREDINQIKRRVNEVLNPESGTKRKQRKHDHARLELLLFSTEVDKLEALYACEEAETKSRAEESRALDSERKIQELEAAMASLRRTYEENLEQCRTQSRQFQTNEGEMRTTLQDARLRLTETQSDLYKAQQAIVGLEATHSIEKGELGNQLEDQTALYQSTLGSLQRSCEELENVLNEKQNACSLLEGKVNDRETGTDDSGHARVYSLKGDVAQLEEFVLTAYMQIDETKRVAAMIYSHLCQSGLNAGEDPVVSQDNGVDEQQLICIFDANDDRKEVAAEKETVDEAQNMSDCSIKAKE